MPADQAREKEVARTLLGFQIHGEGKDWNDFHKFVLTSTKKTRLRVKRQATRDLHLLNVFNEQDAFLFWATCLERQCAVSARGTTFVFDKDAFFEKYYSEICDIAMECGSSDQFLEACEGLCLKSYTRLEWHEYLQPLTIARQVQLGWNKLDDDQFEKIWALAESKFNFLDSRDMKPQPSATWDLANLCSLEESGLEFRSLAIEVELKTLKALKSLQFKDWFALDYNHPSFRLEIDKCPSNLADWLVSLVPTADEAIFFSSDYSCGIFTELRKSVTYFGSDLISAVKADLPRAFCMTA